jgi:hypothetical protein
MGWTEALVSVTSRTSDLYLQLRSLAVGALARRKLGSAAEAELSGCTAIKFWYLNPGAETTSTLMITFLFNNWIPNVVIVSAAR